MNITPNPSAQLSCKCTKRKCHRSRHACVSQRQLSNRGASWPPRIAGTCSPTRRTRRNTALGAVKVEEARVQTKGLLKTKHGPQKLAPVHDRLVPWGQVDCCLSQGPQWCKDEVWGHNVASRRNLNATQQGGEPGASLTGTIGLYLGGTLIQDR